MFVCFFALQQQKYANEPECGSHLFAYDLRITIIHNYIFIKQSLKVVFFEI